MMNGRGRKHCPHRVLRGLLCYHRRRRRLRRRRWRWRSFFRRGRLGYRRGRRRWWWWRWRRWRRRRWHFRRSLRGSSFAFRFLRRRYRSPQIGNTARLGGSRGNIGIIEPYRAVISQPQFLPCGGRKVYDSISRTGDAADNGNLKILSRFNIFYNELCTHGTGGMGGDKTIAG
jgi:hypothetical protein